MRKFFYFLLLLNSCVLRAQTTNLRARDFNNIRYASQFANGSNAGVKIASAIADLPSTGGTVIAEDLLGTQTISADPFAGVTKPIILRLGCATYNISVIMSPPSNTKIVGADNCSTLNFIDDGSPTSRELYIVNASNVMIDNVTITSTATSRTGVYGLVRVENSSNIKITRNTLLVSPSTCIWTMTTTDFLIDGNICNGPKADGIHITRASLRGRISNNDIINTADDGIGLISYTDPTNNRANNSDITVTGNTIRNVTVGRGIAVYGGNDITVAGNTIADIDQTGIIVSAANNNGVYNTATTHNPYKIIVTSNSIRNGGRNFGGGQGSCIYVNPARLITVSNNIVDTCGTDGITLAGVTKDIIVNGNDVSRPTGRGISIDATTSTDSQLILELFTNLGEAGVVTATSSNVSFNGNQIRLAAGAGIYASIANPAFLQRLSINNNIIKDCQSATYAANLIRIEQSTVNDNAFNNCANGLQVSAGDHVGLTGNVGSSLTGGAAILFIGSTYCNVSGGVIYNNPTIGVFFDAGSTDGSVIGVLFHNNGTDIQDTPTGTVKGNKFGGSNDFIIDHLSFSQLDSTITTTFTNGTGGAMPTNIEKMLSITVNGVAYKIPMVKP